MEKPNLLEIQLTGRCNLHCRYCGNSEEYLNDSGAKIDVIMKAITELTPKRILFTGGEVYLEWDLLLEILEKLRSMNYQCSYTLSSNLTMISTKELGLLIDMYGFDTFHSSFNDLDENMSKTVRGNTPQGRKKLIHNLEYLCSKSVTIKVETMLIKGTIHKLREINELLASIGVMNHKLEFLIPVGQAQKDIEVEYADALDKVIELYKSKKQ